MWTEDLCNVTQLAEDTRPPRCLPRSCPRLPGATCVFMRGHLGVPAVHGRGPGRPPCVPCGHEQPLSPGEGPRGASLPSTAVRVFQGLPHVEGNCPAFGWGACGGSSCVLSRGSLCPLGAYNRIAVTLTGAGGDSAESWAVPVGRLSGQRRDTQRLPVGQYPRRAAPCHLPGDHAEWTASPSRGNSVPVNRGQHAASLRVKCRCPLDPNVRGTA